MIYAMAQGSVDSDRLSSAGLSTHSSAGTIGGAGSVLGVRVGESKQDEEDDYTLGPLPPMWEKAYTPTGEAYFIDHNTGTSHWLDPRLARVRKRSLAECGEDELPFGWERVEDARYGAYFVDHLNRRTQYENPVLQARRLRAAKLGVSVTPSSGHESTGPGPGSSGTSIPSHRGRRTPSQLNGERFNVTLIKSAQGLGFTLVGGTSCEIDTVDGDLDLDADDGNETLLQIRSIVTHSPAWLDGNLRPGDVLIGVCGRNVLGASHRTVAELFQSIPPGTPVSLELCRGYPLAYDANDPNTRVLTTVAVQAVPSGTPLSQNSTSNGVNGPASTAPNNGNTPTKNEAIAMRQLTDALRNRFNLETPTKHSDMSTNDNEVASANAPKSPVSLGARSTTPGSTTTPSRATRRMLSRSFDLDELVNGDDLAEERTPMPKRCPSADHLLGVSNGSGTELSLRLRRGAAGFGFTIADSVHGQKVKKVLDRGRCCGLREGDLLLAIGGTDVSNMPHQHVVQVLKECPAMQDTIIRVWRKPAPNRTPPTNHVTQYRSKTPTAEQCAALARLGAGASASMGVTGAPRAKTPLVDTRHLPDADTDDVSSYPSSERQVQSPQQLARRRRSLTPAQTVGSTPNTPTKHSINGATTPLTPTSTEHRPNGFWRNAPSVGESSDNGGFTDEAVSSATITTAISQQGSNASNDMNVSVRRAQSPSCFTCHTGTDSPLQTQISTNHGMENTNTPTNLYQINLPQVEAAGSIDPEADVLVRLARGSTGFGFRIVGGTEDGSTITVGHVVPGGPASGLLCAGDILTSVDGQSLVGASHARAVNTVCRAANNGHVTLGVRHNRHAPVQNHPGLIPQHMLSITPDETPIGYSAMLYQGEFGSAPILQLAPYATNPQYLPGSMPPQLLHPAPVYATHYNERLVGGMSPQQQYDSSLMYRTAPLTPVSSVTTPTVPYDVIVSRNPGEGFGFVVISSTNRATSSIGQLIPGSPAARCGLLNVGDTILAINHAPIRHLPHPDIVALIKHSGPAVTLTIQPVVVNSRPR